MTQTEMMNKKPLISVVVEGYTQSIALNSVEATMTALKNQDFPLKEVVVILVGSSTQCNKWEKIYSQDVSFFAVKTLTANTSHYFELKNKGAEVALGEIIAFIDSDCFPTKNWLDSIVNGISQGADVVAGLTLFQGESGWNYKHPLMQIAASITWGFIAGNVIDAETVEAKDFLCNNLGFRTEIFKRHQFRTDLGRTCAGTLLYKNLIKSKVKVIIQPKQQVVHPFSPIRWVLGQHMRFGYEVFMLKRLDENSTHHWVTKIAIIEPLLTMAWHILLDIPQWFKYSRLLKVSWGYRFLLLPILIMMSIAARGAEMFGMYWTLIKPQEMKTFAESR